MSVERVYRFLRHRPGLVAVFGIALTVFASVRASYTWRLADISRNGPTQVTVAALAAGRASPGAVSIVGGSLALERVEKSRRRIRVPLVDPEGEEVILILDSRMDPDPAQLPVDIVHGIYDGEEVHYGRTRSDFVLATVGHVWLAVLGLAFGPMVIALRSLRRVPYRKRPTIRSVLWVTLYVGLAVPGFLIDRDSLSTLPVKWLGVGCLVLAIGEIVVSVHDARLARRRLTP